MTEAELVQIEQGLVGDSVGAWSAVGLMPKDVPALVAEVRRLQGLIALAVLACRDEALPDGACRFAVLGCLVPQPPLTEADIRFGRELAASLNLAPKA